MGDNYIAVYCPNCGQHLNDFELDLPHAAPAALTSGTYNCGWCKRAHGSLDDVAICRESHKTGMTVGKVKAAREVARAARLHATREDLIALLRETDSD